MEIKEKIEEIVEKVKSDKDFGKHFKEDPIKAWRACWAPTCPTSR